MEKDLLSQRYLADNARYADLINGFIFHGDQLVKTADMQEMDSKTGFWKKPTGRRRRKGQSVKYRDLIRKVALGTKFAVIGIENQSDVNYIMPVRVMGYDVGEYERQAANIKKRVRGRKNIRGAEFVSGFAKDSRLIPCVTIVVYWGEEEWEHGRNLHDILDFSEIPPALRQLVNNYHVNLLNVREFTDTSVFRTDLKQVFDFIRYSEDEKKLKVLVEEDEGYKNMEEDAFDFISLFTKKMDAVQKQKYRRKGDKYDMCGAIKGMIETGKQEGREEERNRNLVTLVYKKVQKGKTLEVIADELEEDIEEIRPVYNLVVTEGQNSTLGELCEKVKKFTE